METASLPQGVTLIPIIGTVGFPGPSHRTASEISSQHLVVDNLWEIPHRVEGLAGVGELRAGRERGLTEGWFLISYCAWCATPIALQGGGNGQSRPVPSSGETEVLARLGKKPGHLLGPAFRASPDGVLQARGPQAQAGRYYNYKGKQVSSGTFLAT